MRRNGRSGHLCAYALAPGLERSLRGTSRPTTAPRSTSWQARPKRWAFGWTRYPSCGLTALHTGISPRARFSGKPSGHSSFLASWRVLASERARQAGLARHLDTGKAGAAQGRGRRQLPVVQRCTRHHDPPLLRVPGIADRKRHVRLTGGARRHARWVLNAGSSSHTAFSRTLAPFSQQVFLNASARSSGTIGPHLGFWRHIFTDGSSSGSGALRRAGWAVVAVDGAGNLKAACGGVPSDVVPGQCARDGEDYAAAMAGQFTLDPLMLYIDCEGTIATINGPKHKALGARGRRAHVWNRLLFSHDEVRAVKVKGHAEAGRTSHWCRKGNDLADTFAKKGADTHKPTFRVAKTVVACASLAKQAARWAAEARVLLRIRGWNDTRAAAPRSRVRPPRARLKRRREKEIAAPAAGQVSRKTVTSTLAHSEGTACNWDEFSMLEAELWITPSSFAPSVELSTGSVRTLFAANAANSQVAERRSYAN